MLINFSYKVQNIASRMAQPFLYKKPNKTVGKPSFKVELVTLLDKPLPMDTGLAPMRELLNINDANTVHILSHPEKSNADSPSVFYFPSYGSERLYSQISLATIVLLYHQGIKVVLPPSYLCCGYPQRASGDEAKGKAISTDNRVLFHRMANTLKFRH